MRWVCEKTCRSIRSAPRDTKRGLLSQREADSGDDRIPLTLFGGGIVDQDAVHVFIRPVAAVVPSPPIAMLDTAKKRGVTLLYWRLAGGRFFARKVAGESFAGLGTDCTVKSARWSFVKKRRPVPPCGGPASSLKIFTGISTLAPVLGTTYFRHSVATAAAGTRLKVAAAIDQDLGHERLRRVPGERRCVKFTQGRGP
jgi:hypothetical protein